MTSLQGQKSGMCFGFRLMLIQNVKTLKENAVCMCSKLGEIEFIL